MSLPGRIGAVGATLLLLAGCSGGSAGDATAAPPGGQNEFAAYTRCLQQNGVTLPTMDPSRPTARPSGRPGPSGRPRPSADAAGRPGRGGFGKPAGVDDATWQKAQAACAKLRPTAGPGGQGRPGQGRPGQGGPGRGPDAAYRNCRRDHGVDGTATADPAALDACKVLSPTPAP